MTTTPMTDLMLTIPASVRDDLFRGALLRLEEMVDKIIRTQADNMGDDIWGFGKTPIEPMVSDAIALCRTAHAIGDMSFLCPERSVWCDLRDRSHEAGLEEVEAWAADHIPDNSATLVAMANALIGGSKEAGSL